MRLADQVRELGKRLALVPPGERPPEDLLEYMQVQRDEARAAWILRGVGEPFWVMNQRDGATTFEFVQLAGIAEPDAPRQILGLPVCISTTVTEPPFLAFRAATAAETAPSRLPVAGEAAG